MIFCPRFLIASVLLNGALPVFGQTDLALSQSDAPDPLEAGANITYTLKIQNLGPNVADNLLLSSVVPPNTTFVSFTKPAGWGSSTPAVGGTGTVSANIASLSAIDGVSGNPIGLVALGGTVLFSAENGSGRELWKSDGTAAGTVLVKDIHPTGGSNPGYMTNVNGTIFFRADDGVNGTELWKSDGTTAGTLLVKNIHPAGDGSPYQLTNVNGTLFFTAHDGVNGEELWKSDGTAAGTGLVKVIVPGTSDSQSGPFNLVAVGSTLFFVVPTETLGGYQLWKSDGTAAGTILLKDFTTPNTVNPPTRLTASNGVLLFLGHDSAHGYELWRSDGTPQGTALLKDINPGTTGSGGYSETQMVDANGTLYFTPIGGPEGRELWKSDGTAAGTVLVKDINPGTADSQATWLTNVNGTLFFRATNGSSGEELWKSNGTAPGTVLVKDINPGAANSSANGLYAANATLFFAAIDATHGQELWKSDGTTAGTVLVKDIVAGTGSPVPQGFTNVNGTLFFRAADAQSGGSGVELWKSDGTAAGTVQVRNLNSPAAEFTLVVKVNPGTASGTTITSTATLSSATSDPLPANNSTTVATSVITPTADLSVVMTDSVDPVVSGNQLSYTITVTNAGPTAAANVVLTDVVPTGTTFYDFTAPAGWTSTTPNIFQTGTVTSSIPSMPVGTAEFTLVVGTNTGLADNSTINNTASVTSPTGDPVGSNNSDTETTLVRTPRADLSVTTIDSPDPVFPDSNVTYNITITNLGLDATRSGINFTASVPAGTTYVSGPTAASGFNLPAGADLSSSPSRLITFNGALIFAADDGTTGRELWQTDGTTAGTTRLLDINSGAEDSMSPTANPMVELDGLLYFSATDAVNGTELWRSNGTPGGTVIFKNIRAGSANSSPHTFTKIGSTIFFSANDGSGYELWKTDGTAAGTVRVKDINPGPDSSVFEKPFRAVGNTLYFAADDGGTGEELWRSDGTAAGTVRIKDIRPGTADSDPRNFTEVGEILFFTAFTFASGTELWRSDGTEAGTFMVADLLPGSGDSSPGGFTAYNGMLIFSAFDGFGGFELWRSDGTGEGTVPVRETHSAIGSSPNGFAELNGVLYFEQFEEGIGAELWRTDGTEEGTWLVRDIRPGPGWSEPTRPVNLNGTLFFTANDGTNGVELWRSDGTEYGTMLVRNIHPTGNSSPSGLTLFNGALVFVADDGVNGRELWRSDGTPAGTAQVRNIQAINAVTYSLVVKVNSNTPAGTVLSQTATVSHTTPGDPVPGNNSATTQTTVVAFNVPPTLSGIEVAPLDYVEDDPPTPVTATLLPSDANGFSLTGGTVAIAGNYFAGEDMLVFTDQLGITGSFNSANGVLTLSGTASLTNYRTALRAVTYYNASYFPNTLQRVIRFQVNDGAVANNLSNIVTRAIDVTALDDTPRFISITSEAGQPGSYRLVFQGIAGRTYMIDFTDSLVPSDWQPLAIVQSDGQGMFGILDTPVPGVNKRFYRARWLP